MKFSTTTSTCSTSRRTSSRPSGVEKSIVTDRLAGLVPWKVGPNSIQSGSVGRLHGGEAHAVGPGRRLDLEHVGAEGGQVVGGGGPGPERGEVEHGHAVERQVACRHRWPAGAAPAACRAVTRRRRRHPTRARRATGRTGDADMRNGDRGARNPSGRSTNTSRSTKWSIVSTSRPLPTSATGTRNSSPSSQISAGVCVSSHGRTTDSASSRLRAAAAHRVEPVVGREVFAPDHRREVGPLLRGEHAEADPTVLAADDLGPVAAARHERHRAGELPVERRGSCSGRRPSPRARSTSTTGPVPVRRAYRCAGDRAQRRHRAGGPPSVRRSPSATVAWRRCRSPTSARTTPAA